MKIRLAIVLGLVVVSSTQLVSAQPGRGPGRGPGPHGGPGAQQFPPPIAAVLDANKDGVLSGEEILGAEAALLKLDANKDGQLAGDELCPGVCPNGQRPAAGVGQGAQRGKRQRNGWGAQKDQVNAGGGGRALLALFDVNKDAILSSAELAAAPVVLAQFDTNGDDQITPLELRPGPGCRGASGCGMNNPNCPKTQQ